MSSGCQHEHKPFKKSFQLHAARFSVPSHYKIQFNDRLYVISYPRKMTSHLPITVCIVILYANFAVHLIPSIVRISKFIYSPKLCGCNHSHGVLFFVSFSLMPPVSPELHESLFGCKKIYMNIQATYKQTKRSLSCYTPDRDQTKIKSHGLRVNAPLSSMTAASSSIAQYPHNTYH